MDSGLLPDGLSHIIPNQGVAGFLTFGVIRASIFGTATGILSGLLFRIFPGPFGPITAFAVGSVGGYILGWASHVVIAIDHLKLVQAKYAPRLYQELSFVMPPFSLTYREDQLDEAIANDFRVWETAFSVAGRIVAQEHAKACDEE